jgi:hypothetical protein
MRRAPRAPSSLAPVSTTATTAGTVGVGGRLEEHVDRRAGVVDGRVGGERHGARSTRRW